MAEASYPPYIAQKLELQMTKVSIAFSFCWLKTLAFVLVCMS